MKKLLLALTLTIVSSLVLAHSEPVSSTPANGSTVKVMPASVKLNFDEAVEVAFSNFKVYAYSGEVTNGKLRAFAQQKTPLKNDAATRADAGVTSSGTTKTVNVKLKPNLKAGTYVVMWKALGADTHTVEGYVYFRLKP
jgi:copper resistance protein C